MAESFSPLNGLDIPPHYHVYYDGLFAEMDRAVVCAKKAKATKNDISTTIDSKIASDLADRVSKMLDIDIATRLRELLVKKGKECAALFIADEIAHGMHLPADSGRLERVDLAIRVGLATVTEGVTIAPLQGISGITIKKNRDDSEYLSLSIAGPMRSAGGTESAATLLIADHVRQAVGLGKYQADSFDDETGRFVEELRTYEREASSFQYRVTDEDIVKAIKNLPVELDGVETDPVEVVNHKDMKRIKTPRVRGGALRVLNDGLIGRSKKLLKRVEKYNLEGWEWLRDLQGATQMHDEDNASTKRLKDVITGRSVLSKPKLCGGFRLRYGRACNTGFTAVGIHPAIAELLDHVMTVGTQIKTDIPGKGATVAFVDSIDTPIVRLKNGDVVKIRDIAHGISLKDELAEILHLGDILVSFGDFVENNATMPASGYVEEYWAVELIDKLGSQKASKILDSGVPTLVEACELSRSCGVGLHPAYLHYWDQISSAHFLLLLEPESRNARRIVYSAQCKLALEYLGVPHRNDEGKCVLEDQEADIFEVLLFTTKPTQSNDVLGAISTASGISVRAKFSTAVGVRIGRPEKATERRMKPPTHTLFPIANAGGMTRSLLKVASGKNDFFTDISNRTCDSCHKLTMSIKCNSCNGSTTLLRRCPKCNIETKDERCLKCLIKTKSHSYRHYPLKNELLLAQQRVKVKANEPFKGIKRLLGTGKVAEPLEKGLLRQHNGITVFRDGTIRCEATNAPLTHFKPAWIGTTVYQLKSLGYTVDIHGKPLTSENQLVELFIQDVIIPQSIAAYLANICKYIDGELKHMYGTEPYYQLTKTSDLVGHLVIGLAPHTSAGIITRIIGFSKTQVCFGTPNWHSAKRRDADGDSDSIILLLDVLLNFSRQFLSEHIGGLMDAALLIQPYVLPHEAQEQAHNLEVISTLPLEFFEITASNPKASMVKCIETVKSRLGTIKQYEGYMFTHQTSSLAGTRERSAYSTLGSMEEKLDFQIRTADLINAVDTTEIISNVLTTHLIRDLAGNLRAYSKQVFRCTKCGTRYHRIPLVRKCTHVESTEMCGHKLIATITRPSVEKYLRMATRLVTKYDVGPYLTGQIHNIGTEIEMVFGKGTAQTQLIDYE